jgi:ankyrin repeat protein
MYGHLNVLEYLLGRWDGKRSRGTTPLIVASTNGHLRIVEWLIQNKKVDPNETDASGSTALMLAARDGHLDTVKWLAAREDVDVNVSRPWKGTAIAAACESGHLEVVQFLSAKCDMKQKLPSGVTLLHLAAQCGFLHLVQYLVGLFDAEATSDAGLSALGYAVQSGSVPVAKWLLLEHKVKINPSNGAAYPLGLAMQAGNVKFGRWLIARGAKLTNQVEPNSPLLRAMLVEEVNVAHVTALRNFVNPVCADTIAQYIANWDSAASTVMVDTSAP